MNYLLAILAMFGLTFAISMFVALLISILYYVSGKPNEPGSFQNQLNTRLKNWKESQDLYWKIFKEYRKTEYSSHVEIIRFYYGS
jgi:hypothetical protein